MKPIQRWVSASWLVLACSCGPSLVAAQSNAWHDNRGNLALGAVLDATLHVPALHGVDCHAKRHSMTRTVATVAAVAVTHDVLHRFHIQLQHPDQPTPPWPTVRDAAGYAVGALVTEGLWRLVFHKRGH